jgi:hypothetical protein
MGHRWVWVGIDDQRDLLQISQEDVLNVRSFRVCTGGGLMRYSELRIIIRLKSLRPIVVASKLTVLPLTFTF